jgi:lipoprotein NlpD
MSSRGTTPEKKPTVSSPRGAGARPAASSPRGAVARPAKTISQPLAGKDTQYVVRRGDTLYSVAWQHGLAVNDLVRYNGIRPPYTIYPGQRLRVNGSSAVYAPVRGQPLPPAQAPQTAQVQPAKPASPPPAEPAPALTPQPASAHPAAVAYDGTWQWPTRGRVLRGFQPKATGKKGIDIGGHHAQPVKAAASGKVVYAGSGLVGYGRLIIVKHNDNLLSAYGHNSKLLVAEGDFVKSGDMIAKMGNSGADRTALYFEIRKDGKPVNPMNYLPRN